MNLAPTASTTAALALGDALAIAVQIFYRSIDGRKILAVDVKAGKPFPKPVTLAAIKAEPGLKEMALAKYPRLSVQPVTAQEWKAVCKMGGLKD